MLNQAFSSENFYKILLYENRRGTNIEKKFFYDEIFKKYTICISNLNKLLKKNRRTFIKKDKIKRNYRITKELFMRYKKYLRHTKRKIKEKKEKRLIELLAKISNEVNSTDFKFEIEEKKISDKPIYIIKETPARYFAIRQLQYNFRKLYKIKQANRFEIVNQVKKILEDKFPKYIIKTDIKYFYESIPHSKLLDKLNNDNLLSPMSKKFIKYIIKEYEKISGKKGNGIPRGVGISAYLSEFYMRDIDKKIKTLENLIYYARYVDDIIVIFAGNQTNTIEYFSNFKKIIKDEGLTLNSAKTKNFNFLGGKCSYEIDYLGYKYIFEKKNLKINFTQKKIKKYKEKINLIMNLYKSEKHKNSKKAYRILKSQIKFLTGNTRLAYNKSNILVGIYFNNLLLSEFTILDELDKYLKDEINKVIENDKYKKQLYKHSFSKGFTEKTYHFFKSSQFSKIIKGH